MAVDKVLVRGIRLEASIGVLPWERQVKQPVEVDVAAQVESSELLKTGDLSKGVDFSAVIDSVRRVVMAGHVDLVEVLADRIAAAVLADTPAQCVQVQVRKYSACAGAAAHVGVEVQRERGEHR